MRKLAQRGFTLVELAIVMAIVGLLMAAALYPLRALEETRQREEESLRMESLRSAIVGYALRNRTRERIVIPEGGGRIVGSPFTVPAGRPYLPCPDVDGDGFEDRIPPHEVEDGSGRVLVQGYWQGIELNESDMIVMPLTIMASGNPEWDTEYDERRDDSDTTPDIGAAWGVYGGCMASRGTIPWRTLGVFAADQWGNRYTYFADPLFASALYGFDEKTVANIYDQRIPRVLGLDPPLRAAIEFNTGLADEMDRQCPAVICAGGLAAGGSQSACTAHASPEGCVWNSAESANVVLKAGAIAAEDISDAIASGSGVDFPRGAILEGVPFVIVSHGPNGRGAVNHWSSLDEQFNPNASTGEGWGPICNRGQLTATGTGDRDLLIADDYPRDNHEAVNASRLAPGNSPTGAGRRCPPLLGRASPSDAAGTELLPSVFVWEPGGARGSRTFDDILVWMTREELALEAGGDVPRLSSPIFASP